MPMSKIKPASTIALVFLACVCGVSVANVYFNQAILPIVSIHFGVDSAEVSWLPIASQIGYAAGILLIVPLGDRLDPRRLCVGLALSAAAVLSIASVTGSFIGLAVLTVLVCIATCIPQVLIPYMAGLSSTGRRSRNLAILQAGLVIGILLSRAIAALISERWGWQAVYQCAALGMLVCAFALPHLMPARRNNPIKPSYTGLLTSMIGLWAHEPLLRLSCVLGALIFAAFSAFWSVVALEINASSSLYNGISVGAFSFWGAILGLLAPLAGKLCDRYGTAAMSVLSITLAALASLLLLYKLNINTLIASANILCVSLQIGQISNQSRIFLLSEKFRSRLNTLYMFSNFCGGALGSATGGYLWKKFHMMGPALAGLLCSGVALFTLLYVLRPRPHSYASE